MQKVARLCYGIYIDTNIQIDNRCIFFIGPFPQPTEKLLLHVTHWGLCKLCMSFPRWVEISELSALYVDQMLRVT